MESSTNAIKIASVGKIIDEFLSLYSTVSSETDFFNSSRKRLDGLKHRMMNDQVRVALIGITSSGKSTLLNRILGDNLLPTAVAPSSCQQVICAYDKTLHADVIFKDEMKQKRLVVTKDIQKTLSKFGDEKYNPSNKLGVEEIQVFSPHFRFDHSFIFVDTPGLDAYNLTYHQEITLKMALPQVDMVLFLTNVKCDSDKQNLEYIDKATTDLKPLIVVQNKIDSIEAKLSKTGIEKTREEVKKEHYNRIKKLLSEAQKKSVREAPIVQVSAKNSSWIESNLEELKRVLDEQLKLNSTFREKRFQIQLYRELQNIYELIKSNLGNAINRENELKDANKKIKKWSEHLKDAQNTFSLREQELYEYADDIEMKCNELLKRIDNFIEKHGNTKIKGSLPSDMERLRNEFQQFIEDASKHFSNTISTMEKKLEDCCNDMNLQRDQIVKKEFFGGLSVHVSDCEETKEEEIDDGYWDRVPKPGWINWIKRKTGLGGYEDIWVSCPRIETVTFVDFKMLKNQLKTAYAQFADFLGKNYEKYKKNTEYSLNFLAKEMENRRQEIKTLYECDLPVSSAQKVIFCLEKYINQSSGKASLISSEEAPIEIVNVAEKEKPVDLLKDFIEVELDELVLNSFYYASLISLECHYALMEDIIKKSSLRNIYICGWDIERMEEFRTIYWRNADEVEIIDFNSPKKMPGNNSLIFLLVNSDQTGTIAGKLYNSGEVSTALRKIKESGKIVWVMDSVRALVSISDVRNDNLMESFFEIVRIAQEFMKGKKIYEVMACDRELYYTVLLHEVLFNTELCSKEKKRQNFVCEMEKLFHLSNERVHMTGHYINEFNKLRKEGDI